jgi:1,4-dihydroxy-2-naphthoate octaprenyltransferase
VPVGLATTSILVGNNIRDLDEDAAAGIRTLARIVGARIARAGYVTLTVGAAVLPSLFAAAGWLPLPLLVTPLALPLLSGPLTAVAKGRRLADIDARTARFEAVLLLLMWAGCMVGWFWE